MVFNGDNLVQCWVSLKACLLFSFPLVIHKKYLFWYFSHVFSFSWAKTKMFPVFVDNIPKEAELTDLRELFCRFGPIIDVTIISSHGFVNFKSSSDAVEAINRLNGFRFLGERLVVEASQELEDFLKSKNERSHRSRSPLGKHVSYEVNLLVSYMYTS